MESSRTRLLVTLLVVALAMAGTALVRAHARSQATVGLLVTGPGDTIEVTRQMRSAGLRFRPAVTADDHDWMLAAIARARPEAHALIGAVDGMVEIQTEVAEGPVIGWTRGGANGFLLSFNLRALNGTRTLDREVVVLHELGHVIDRALVPADLRERLDASIPRVGQCTTEGDPTGPCATREERFADTFAKWALRGAVSAVGAGYGIPTPVSLEDWGAPLTALSARVDSQNPS